MLLKKFEEEEKVKEKSKEEVLFLNFYNSLMNYERENRIVLILERMLSYINDLIKEMNYLESITAHEAFNTFSENNIADLKETFDVVKEKLSFIIEDDFEDKTEEALESIILNSKLELLPKIEEYIEALKIGYAYHKNIKLKFNSEIDELQKELNFLIKNKNKEFLREIKKKIDKSAKNILKDRKINLDDISSEDVNFIKNHVLEIEELNKEIFKLYLESKNKADCFFKDVVESLESKYIVDFMDEEVTIYNEPMDMSTLNKRYFKFIENNYNLIRSKLINDIQSKLGAESIENKLEIELIYAQDFIKEGYINKLNKFCEELKAKNNLNVYKVFKTLYGDMLTVEEQINLLEKIYLKVKLLDYEKFNSIKLIDYLKHDK